MNYIVLDMEWNQTHSPNKLVRNSTVLRGEVIQIGAVKMNDSFRVTDRIKLNIAPVFYKTIHNRVKALTGISNAQMRAGVPFKQAFSEFMSWCGRNFRLITWGCDDIPMLKDNMAVHGFDVKMLPQWYNLQVIYNAQVCGNGQQRALHTAMEQLGIENELQAHDALNDAVNTAKICAVLDTKKWIGEYEKAKAMMLGSSTVEGEIRTRFCGYATRGEATGDNALYTINCPRCGRTMSCRKWLRMNSDRKVTVANCSTHGDYYIKLRFKSGCEGWGVVRTVGPADSKRKLVYESVMRRGKKPCAGRRPVKKSADKKEVSVG